MVSLSSSYARALLDSWSGADTAEKRHSIIDRFVKLLEADKMIPLLSGIMERIRQFSEEREKAEAVVAEFARRPAKDQLDKMSIYKISQIKETPSLIGGFKISGNNKIIEASVTGRLNMLHQSLLAE